MKNLRMFSLLVGLGAMTALCPSAADAHIKLLEPSSIWATEDGGKGAPPCGAGFGSNIVTKAQGGHPLTLRILEWIGHPGHYRIALAGSRAQLPPDPEVKEGIGGPKSVSTAIDSNPKPPVIADGVFAHTTNTRGVEWKMDVMLPNITCEKCTLQVIEFMSESSMPKLLPSDSTEALKAGRVFYHACTDLSITADPALPPADKAWTDIAK